MLSRRACFVPLTAAAARVGQAALEAEAPGHAGWAATVAAATAAVAAAAALEG